jgi:Icc protein
VNVSTFSRRKFVAMTGAAGLSTALRGPLFGQASSKPNPGVVEDFTFLFITDTHIQPELNAAQGCDQCFKKARTIQSDFAIQGGDHVFDSLGVGRERATSLFDLYGKTEQDLGMKIYHTMGNHDCFGVYPASGVSPTDPLYGKKMYEDRFGTAYSTRSASPAIAPTRGGSTRRDWRGLPPI